MPQCKLNNCREEAVPHGKRYCPEHLAEYKAKQKAHEKVWQSLPVCAARVSDLCDGKVGPTSVERGQPVCVHCERVLDARREEQEAEDQKLSLLDNAETVADLKDWIKGHLL